MEIKLPSQATGREIIDAFKKALESELWNFSIQTNGSKYEPGSVKRITVSQAIVFNPTHTKRALFSRKTKTINDEPFYGISAVELHKQYETLDMGMCLDRGLMPADAEEFEEFVEFGEWLDDEAETARNKFEKLLGCVYENLGYKQSTQ